ncbi:MAG: D-amino acid aminotransferase [Lautropia sp.]|nr:D-amino acid aminotransferase [Lautropia sp.]
MADEIVYLNGTFLPLAEAHIPVLDRGFIFGDGIYEVVPVYQGKPFRMTEHLARLRRSLDKIRIPNPMDEAGWRQLVQDLIDRHPWPDQFVYLQVTRGVAKRDHGFPANVTPTVFGMSSPLQAPTLASIGAGLSAITLPDERWLHCDIKSTSLLGNVLARQAALDAGVPECIMFRDGFLTEGSASNIWVVKDGKLSAPPRNHLILEGIRYALIEELAAAAGIPFESRPISREEVLAADELMLSSATKEVQPITRVDGQPIGNGQPGPIFQQLFAAYQAAKAANRG